MSEYIQRPEVKARRAEYQRQYSQRPEVKERRKASDAARNARPEIKARAKENRANLIIRRIQSERKATL